MNENQENEKIHCFLALVSPMVTDCVQALLVSRGFQVKQQGSGIDSAFSIETANGDVRFFLHNLLLEIATVDRDEDPLRFDERLLESDFFVQKMAGLIDSKLRPLFCLLRQGTVEDALQGIEALAKDYERLRIWRIDRNLADSQEVRRPGEQMNEKE